MTNSEDIIRKLADHDKRLTILEVTSAERHTATLTAIVHSTELTQAAIAPLAGGMKVLEARLWWCLTTALAGLAGAALQFIVGRFH